MYNSFRPAKYWYDTDGKRIQAHGGSIIFVNGVFYWYGEDKENVTGRATGEKCKIWHNGVRIYSSTDLYNWKNEGTIKKDDNPQEPFYCGRIMDRPHIIYNANTKKFILWAKIGGIIENNEMFENSYFAVCQSDSIVGPYVLVDELKDMPAGDFDLFVEDNKGYIIFEKPHTEMIIASLNYQFTGFEKTSSHLFKKGPPFTREAPAFFVRRGRRFLLTSGTTGYFPNQTQTVEIKELHGEWVELGNSCNDKNSFGVQFSSVFKHPYIEDLYIAIGDMWLTDLPYNMPNINDVFESFFDESKKPFDGNEFLALSDENTSEARYAFLPIFFDDNGTPFIKWFNEWRIIDFNNASK